MRILAIEDDPDTREMYRRMLRDEGHDPILAADGVEGLQLLDPKPDLVILDLALPGMDGYDVLRTIKADATTMTPCGSIEPSTSEPVRSFGVKRAVNR